MPALSLKNVNKVYKRGNVEAVKNVSLDVQEGDFFGLLGPNGAGKTTTIGIISGLINKSAGSIKVFGKDIDLHHREAKKAIGVVAQEINLYSFDLVINVILNQAGYYGIPRKQAMKNAEKYLKMLELWEKRNMPVLALSGGMKRRVMIAKALVHEPKLLILDEPTAGVDIELRASTWDFLKALNKSGVTIILTTHYLEEAEALCKNIAIIDKGEIKHQFSTKELANALEQEVFLFDLEKPVKNLAKDGFHIEQQDEKTLEVTIPRKQSLNEFFDFLNKRKIKVLSMRNKLNRLEQLFLSVVKKK